MPFSGLKDFITALDRAGELHRIKSFADPVLEISEITHRVVSTGGKALLFENTGTDFPLLINAFGSDKRTNLALGINGPGSDGTDIEKLFRQFSGIPSTFIGKIAALPGIVKASAFLPAKSRKKGACQQIIHADPDLTVLPVLKCWPHDGGRFITLPMVHTYNPETGSPNTGMYRIQILGKDMAAMHWQLHKTGANHFGLWKKSGKRMPVTVTLGGDPVYTYSATAPLPENISEYILAGFLRKKRVKLVKCITNDIYIPEDADIVIEGYVDPDEDFVTEGPFGDHTGFYSLADLYPVFHVTCISQRADAVYPATIVGIPPQEDAFFADATEKIFFAPLKLSFLPEIEDFHMPHAGVAHNLLIVRINKKYPGQGLKVINSVFGAGQMMFTKYLVVVSGNVNIRDYKELLLNIIANTDLQSDLVFMKGPLDVLDHSSDNFAFGGKAGIDATVKLPDEKSKNPDAGGSHDIPMSDIKRALSVPSIKSFNLHLLDSGIKLLILSVNPSEEKDSAAMVISTLQESGLSEVFRFVVAVDHTVDINDLFITAWQALGNSDPVRDHVLVGGRLLFIDGTIKYYRKGGFTRPWPNVVCSSPETVKKIDEKWNSLGFKEFIQSPSLKYLALQREGKDSLA